MNNVIQIPDRKLIRAVAIQMYMAEAGIEKAVAFSCGNATRALRDTGVNVLAIAPDGDVAPTRWWTPEEIRREFPDRFDATSGHLPVAVMVAYAKSLKNKLGSIDLRTVYDIETGSGETIVCLRWAYPEARFMPIYGTGKHTQYNRQALLNWVVEGGIDA